jgi:hypothetical protein
MMYWKGYGRKRSWPNVGYSPSIYLEGLRKTSKNLSQDSWSPGRDSSPRPTEYDVELPTTRLQDLVSHSISTTVSRNASANEVYKRGRNACHKHVYSKVAPHHLNQAF